LFQDIIVTVVESIILGVVAFVLGYLLKQYLAEKQMKSAQIGAEQTLEDAKARQREMLLEAKDESLKQRAAAEAESRERRADLMRQERRLQQREENLDHKTEAQERRERAVTVKEQEIQQLRVDTESLKKQEVKELERIAALTLEQARESLMSQIVDEVEQDAARRIRGIEAEAKADADRRARDIISTAIQRYAADQVAESTVSVVPLPNDEMKGRIIGREGRNIRALEQATGVDLVVDDTPEAVILSAFDPVRREIARVALNKLILDGRIHPGRIEEVVAKAKLEVEAVIVEEGEQVALKAGVHGLGPEFIRTLGRLKWRTSYGQNVLMHSLEVAHLSAMMAYELGADVNVARTAGLLHDIGKAVDHDVEGPHAQIGADMAKRLGRSPKIVHAIAAHHGEEEPTTVEAIIVQAADAISSARPGARREALESYVKRLEALETVANSFEGVDKCFAIQAGREIRIIVRPDAIDDLAATRLARDICKKIEESLEYPGQIKVTVIREIRAVDYAK
jgi:ribonucrease Y